MKLVRSLWFIIFYWIQVNIHEYHSCLLASFVFVKNISIGFQISKLELWSCGQRRLNQEEAERRLKGRSKGVQTNSGCLLAQCTTVSWSLWHHCCFSPLPSARTWPWSTPRRLERPRWHQPMLSPRRFLVTRWQYWPLIGPGVCGHGGVAGGDAWPASAWGAACQAQLRFERLAWVHT